MSLAGMLTIIYMHQLVADSRTALVINMLTALTKRVDAIENLCEQAWALTDAQQVRTILSVSRLHELTVT